MISDKVLDALASDEFQIGLVLGAVSLLAILVVARLRHASSRSPVPIAGLLLAGGGAYAISRSSSLPISVAVGLALLAATGFVPGSSPLAWALRAVLLFGGAAVLAASSPDVPEWIPIAVVASATVGGVAAADFDRRFADTGLGPVLFAISVCGVYGTVPETQEALALVGIATPLALGGWPRARARLGGAGALASVGLISWVAATGGSQRPSAVIGALACLGLLAVEPVARKVMIPSADRSPPKSGVLALHLAIVLLASRVAGLRSSSAAALAIASATLVGAGLVMAWWMLQARSRP